MKPASFDLKLATLGPERVLVNGSDVTELVAGVSLLSQEGQPPIVRLGLKPGVEVHEIAGDGVVEVEAAGDDVVRFLSRIDPVQLEKEAMDAFEPGDTVVGSMLRRLQVLARGG